VKLDFAIVARLNPKGKTPWHRQMREVSRRVNKAACAASARGSA
jgi:hypothetical protein